MARKYYIALLTLLPPGKIWKQQWIFDLCLGLSKVFQRIEDQAIEIFINQLSDNVSDYLEEWSSVLGISNPNAAKIRGKLGSEGGQATGNYRDLISRISSNQVVIDYQEPSRCGMECGHYLANEEWSFVVILRNIKDSDLDTIQTIIDGMKQAHLKFLYYTE